MEVFLEFARIAVWPAVTVYALLTFKSSIISALEKVVELNLGGEKGLRLKLNAVQKAIGQESEGGGNEAEKKILRNVILSLPDDDFMFLDELSKRPIESRYVPRKGSELRHLYSLADHGIFKQHGIGEFSLTEIGRHVIESIQ